MNSINSIKDITVITVTFHSGYIVESLIKALDEKIKIIVVDNSLDEGFKKSLEKKFRNVEVVIPKKNLGVGGGINHGLSLVKTKFSLHLSADTVPNKGTVNCLLQNATKIKNFSVLAPRIENYTYRENEYIEKNLNNKFHKMKYVIGAALLINMDSLNKVGKFDENIFLYYEEMDFYFRCLKNGLDIYLIDEASIVHHGAASVDKKYNFEITLNRNWHYNWSKFYYYKKNYGYFYGIKKTIPNLVRSIKKYCFYTFKKDKDNRSLHMAEIQGLLSSYFLKKSSRRPKLI